MNVYNISKGQLVTLWFFGGILWLGDAVYASGSSSGFALFLLVLIPASLVFYTIGWRNFNKSKSFSSLLKALWAKIVNLHKWKKEIAQQAVQDEKNLENLKRQDVDRVSSNKNETAPQKKTSFPGYWGAYWVSGIFYSLSKKIFEENQDKMNSILGNDVYYSLLHLGIVIASGAIYIVIVKYLNFFNKKRNGLLNFGIKIVAGILSIVLMALAFGFTTGYIYRNNENSKINALTKVIEENKQLFADQGERNKELIRLNLNLAQEEQRIYEAYTNSLEGTVSSLEKNIDILKRDLNILKQRKELYRNFYEPYTKLTPNFLSAFGLSVNDPRELLSKFDELYDKKIDLDNLRISIFDSAIRYKNGLSDDADIINSKIKEETSLLAEIDQLEKTTDDLSTKFIGALFKGFPESITSQAIENADTEYKEFNDLGINLKDELQKLTTN